MEYEHLLKATGGFGRLQLFMLFTMGILCFKAIAELQLMVLTMTGPEFRCSNQNTSGYVPQDFGAHCQILTLSNKTSNGTLEECTGFEYNQGWLQWTLVQEYNLICGREWYITLLNSIYFLGLSVGIAVSTLGDRVGRKKIFYAAGVLDVFGTILPVFMPDIGSQIAARFLKGIPTTAYSQGLLLLQEFTMEQHRGRVGNAYWMFWCFGYMASGAIAFLLQDWRHIQIASLSFCISYPLIAFFVPESPRWLVLKGRTTEAAMVFKQMAKWNGVEWRADRELEVNTGEQPTGKVQQLFTFTQMRKKTFVIFLMMLVHSFCYFGIAIDTTFITRNIFLNAVISGALEAPSYMIGALVCEKIGRRLPTLIMTQISGVCIIATAFLLPNYTWGTYLQVSVAIIGKTALTSAYSVMGIFSTELFPTSVRNSGMFLAILLGYIINTLSPVIVSLGRVKYYLPGVLFGSVAIASSLSINFLPETKGLQMPETVPQSEGLVKGHEEDWAVEQRNGCKENLSAGTPHKVNAVGVLHEERE